MPRQRTIFAIASRLLEWFSRNARDLPWRRTRDPYRIFVSEIMLQQTQVSTVLPYYARWLEHLPNIRALAAAPERRLLKLWEGLGYYSRVRNLQKAAKAILANHSGKFPRDYEQVLELPGVGRYTAGAVCSIAFNQPTPVVDGNVKRVLARLFAIEGDPQSSEVTETFWNLGERLVTTAHVRFLDRDDACGALNQAIMELGALLCTRVNPSCDRCPVASMCKAKKTRQINRFPSTSSRPSPQRKLIVVLVVTCGDKVLVRQRPATGHNAFFWEFPCFEEKGRSAAAEMAELLPGLRLSPPVHVATARHTITRYRITLNARACSVQSTKKIQGMRWIPLASLKSLPFSTAHRKLLQKAEASFDELGALGNPIGAKARDRHPECCTPE